MQDQEIIPTEHPKEKVEEQVPEPVKKDPPCISNEKNWFEIVYTSVLGFVAAIAVVLFSLFLLFGLGYWCYEGYCRWFSTDGMCKVVNREEIPTWIYSSIEEITYSQYTEDSDGYCYYKDISTGMYMYEDAHHHYGLMSKDFVWLTKPLFSNITALSEDVFFAEYLDSGLGILLNKNGQIIK